MFQIQLREYITKETIGYQTSDLHVVLIKDGDETILVKYEGYDAFSETKNFLNDAEKYLNTQAKFFDAEVLPRKTFKKVEVKTYEWHEI